MKTVILDTDFLVHCASFKIDYIEELKRILDFNYKVFIIDKTVDELDSIIENQKGKAKADAKLAKATLKAMNIPEIKTKKDRIVDELILQNLTKEIIVATMDADLKRRLKQRSVPIIVIRQKKYLKLFNY